VFRALTTPFAHKSRLGRQTPLLHNGHDRIGGIAEELGVPPELLETAGRGNRIAIVAHKRQMSAKRLAGIDERFLQRVSG
jgi:hypothetical protein